MRSYENINYLVREIENLRWILDLNLEIHFDRIVVEMGKSNMK